MREDLQIIDESGDKKYFSQLPHYILNHSTAIDQSLYWQMKRFAGETGKCFASQKTIMEKMHVGKKAFQKSLKYLLDRGWIKFIGTTASKTRPLNTYSVVDIWKLNIDNYEEIGAKRTLSKSKDKGSKNLMIRAQSDPKEYLTNKNINKINTIVLIKNEEPEDINSIIDLFKNVNPSYKRLFGNKTQRSCLSRLIKEHGREKVISIINFLPQSNSMEYAPRIFTPLELENKLGALLVFGNNLKNKQNKNKIESI